MPAPPGEMNRLWIHLRTTIAAALPQVAEDHIWRARQVARLGYDTMQTPFCVVILNSAPESEFSPINGTLWQPEVEIYYVQDEQKNIDNAALVENELEQLGFWFRDNDLGYAQTMAIGMPDAEQDNPINMLVSKGKIPRVGGSIKVNLLFGRIGR